MDCQEIRGDLRAAAASYSAQRQQSAPLPTAKDVRSPQSLSINVCILFGKAALPRE